MPALRAHIVETLADLDPGIEVLTAGDGVEAIERIDANPRCFDLIVCDIIMPRMDGEALLLELQRRAYGAPIIMLTALGQDDTIIRCLRLGACDYLVKPVGIDELVAAGQCLPPHAPAQPPGRGRIRCPRLVRDQRSKTMRQCSINTGKAS